MDDMTRGRARSTSYLSFFFPRSQRLVRWALGPGGFGTCSFAGYVTETLSYEQLTPYCMGRVVVAGGSNGVFENIYIIYRRDRLGGCSCLPTSSNAN